MFHIARIHICLDVIICPAHAIAETALIFAHITATNLLTPADAAVREVATAWHFAGRDPHATLICRPFPKLVQYFKARGLQDLSAKPRKTSTWRRCVATVSCAGVAPAD